MRAVAVLSLTFLFIPQTHLWFLFSSKNCTHGGTGCYELRGPFMYSTGRRNLWFYQSRIILRVIKDMVRVMQQVKGLTLNPAAMDIEVLELGGISVPKPVVLPILEAGLPVLKTVGGVPFLHQDYGYYMNHQHFNLNNGWIYMLDIC